MVNSYKYQKKGFTLVELLVVIGILAILATVTLLVLNPAQLLAQSRDSQRVSDLAALNSAIGLYVATATTSVMDIGGGCATKCWTYIAAGANCDGRHSGKTMTTVASAAVNSSGWVPIDFRNTTGGAPLGALPVDPTNSGLKYYSYVCDDTNETWELDTVLESTKYGPDSTTDNKSGKDGGSSTTVYEIGNDPGLDL